MAKDKAQPEQPGNGPYHWGNGPKPKGKLARILEALRKKKK